MNRIDTTQISSELSSNDHIHALGLHGIGRALVVADDPLVREGLELRLGLVAAAEPSLGETVADAIARTDAAFVLWDLGPTGEREDELLAHLGGGNEVPVIALVPARERRPVGAVSIGELVAAGVAGVLAREVDPIALQHAVDAVLHGLCVIDRVRLSGFETVPSTEPVADVELDSAPRRGSADGLTAREREVVRLMAEGLSNKQIADRLGISSHTSKFHVNAVLAKLGASTRTEAVVRALQRGVVML